MTSWQNWQDEGRHNGRGCFLFIGGAQPVVPPAQVQQVEYSPERLEREAGATPEGGVDTGGRGKEDCDAANSLMAREL